MRSQQLQQFRSLEYDKQLILSQGKNSQFSQIVVKISIFLFILGVFYLALNDKLLQMNKQIEELSQKNQHLFAQSKEVTPLKSELKSLKKTIGELEYKNKKMQQDLSKLYNEILDIHMNQLVKDGGNIYVLKKYGERFNFNIDKSKLKGYYFRENFKIEKQYSNSIIKISQKEAFFFSELPFPKKAVSYIEIKVKMSKNCKILIGVIPSSKRFEDCVYCDSKQIAYFYGENGKIYSGEYLGLINTSKQSLFERVKLGDKVSMFINYKENLISWYVNDKYAGKQELINELKNIDLYPFVQLTDYAETVQIIE